MNDHDYIKNRFENDGLEPSEKISADSLRSRIADASGSDPRREVYADPSGTGAPGVLDAPVVPDVPDAPGAPGTSGRPRWRRPLIGLAACACLVIALIPIAGKGFFGSSNSTDPANDTNGLQSFSDYAELDRTLDDILDGQQNYYYGLQDDTLSMTEDVAEAPAGVDGEMAAGSDAAMAKGDDVSGNSTGTDHSTTYTQVDDVDEADVVKTDGKYIYHVSYMENQVIISEARDGKTKRLSSVGVEGDSLIDDIYIDGDRLIVVSETRIRTYYGSDNVTINEEMPSSTKTDDAIPSVAITCYDISDRAKPKKSGRYTQSGSLLSSRMTDGNILLVTNQSVYRDQKTGRFPTLTYDGEEPKDLDIDCIQCIPSPSSSTYTIIGMIDPSRGKISEKETQVRAVLGGSEQIYCNTEELYITATVFKDEGRRSPFPWISNDPISFEQETRILKVDFSKEKIAYTAMGTIPGTVNDQFSMDAKDGYLRIATTARSSSGDTNDLFILDEKLKEVGSIRNFARDEHIEAVRYIGDYAYVITYEQIDPLFIIDLSDPKDPKIRGHVKISGFSTLLVPVDSDHILGFGFATENTDTGESTDGLKLALFDVSDPQEPKVADSMSLSDVSSEIQYDHKALLVGPEGSYYAIPYDRYYDTWTDGVEIDDAEIVDVEDASDNESEGIDTGRKGNADYDNGVMLFDARGGRLELKKQFGSDSSVKRCIYIGNWIYAVCTDDSIKGYKL